MPFMTSYKLEYDAYKHLTTLSTGSIVILATFLEKLFTNPEWKILLPITFLCFTISIVGSAIAMFGIAAEIREHKNPKYKPPLKFAFVMICFAIFGFIGGIILFVIFTIKNLM